MGKPFTDSEKEYYKNRIVEEGKRKFSGEPFKDVKIIDIAVAAGVGKGTFYTFFSSKEELFFHLIGDVEKELHGKILEKLSSSKNIKESLRDVMTEIVHMVRHDEMMKAMLDDRLLASMIEKLEKETVEQMYQRDGDLISSIVDLGLELKVEKDIAVDLLRGVFFTMQFERELSSNLDSFYKQYVDMIINHVFV